MPMDESISSASLWFDEKQVKPNQYVVYRSESVGMQLAANRVKSMLFYYSLTLDSDGCLLSPVDDCSAECRLEWQ